MGIEALYRRFGIDDDVLSFHEAGHAVVAVTLGFHVEWVSTDRGRVAQLGFPRLEAFTKVRLRPDPTICPVEELTDDLIAQLQLAPVWLAAGELAQQRGTNRILAEGTARDLPLLRKVFDRLRSIRMLADTEAFVAWVEATKLRANAVLDEQWNAVHWLAKELKRRRIVDGAVIRQRIRGLSSSAE